MKKRCIISQLSFFIFIWTKLRIQAESGCSLFGSGILDDIFPSSLDMQKKNRIRCSNFITRLELIKFNAAVNGLISL